MVDFYKFKAFLVKILGKSDQNIEQDNNNDVKITFPDRYDYYQRNNSNEILSVLLINDELREAYNNINTYQTDSLMIYNNFYCEVAMDRQYFLRKPDNDTINVDDAVNGISYSLDLSSFDYSIYLLLQAADYYYENKRKLSPYFLNRVVRFRSYAFHERDDLSEVYWKDIIPYVVGAYSLKIRSVKSKNNKQWNIIKHAFSYQYMYKSKGALIEFKSIITLFKLDNSVRKVRLEEESFNSPPLRVFNEDVIDYYRLALSTDDAYIQFISFYHVLEYFFDEVFKNKLVSDLKNKITHPDFSYNDDEKVYELAQFVKHRMRSNDDSGQGDELESLKYVLNEYVDFNDLKNSLNSYDTTLLSYYESNKVIFSNAPTISFSDIQGIVTFTAKRIYFTRNALVHRPCLKNKSCTKDREVV